jgi:hypothetical protein
MPFCSVDSRREPEPIQIPTETLRTCGITSVITRTPLLNVLISMSREGLFGGVIAEERKKPIPFVAPSGRSWDPLANGRGFCCLGAPVAHRFTPSVRYLRIHLVVWSTLKPVTLTM